MKDTGKTTLRFHVNIKGTPREVRVIRDQIITALNQLDLTVERMPDETRVHVSPNSKAGE